MIFDSSLHYDTLPSSDSELKKFLNYNPVHNNYTRKQNIPGRNPNETDRGGWRGYDRVYSKYFHKLKNENLKIMEIGIKEGYGIYAWQNYFTNASLYGIDIDWNPSIIVERNNLKQRHPQFKKARLYNIDSTKEDNWIEFYGKKFDIIIDDGDHHPDTQIATFKSAWKYLKSGGLYFIEDIGHRYGKSSIERLSDFILSYRDEFKDMEIYHHDNVGLKYQLSNERFCKERGITENNVSSLEYIVAIRKK